MCFVHKWNKKGIVLYSIDFMSINRIQFDKFTIKLLLKDTVKRSDYSMQHSFKTFYFLLLINNQDIYNEIILENINYDLIIE